MDGVSFFEERRMQTKKINVVLARGFLPGRSSAARKKSAKIAPMFSPIRSSMVLLESNFAVEDGNFFLAGHSEATNKMKCLNEVKTSLSLTRKLRHTL